MSVVTSSRGTDMGARPPSVLFPSQQSFRYASSHGAPSDHGQAPYGSNGVDPTANPRECVWGTDVLVEDCIVQFVDFLRNSKFTIEGAEMDEARMEWQQEEQPRALYLTKLEEIHHVPNEPYLTVNCAHLKEYNLALYRKLQHYPNEMIEVLDMSANSLYQELYPEDPEITIRCRPFNIDQTYTIRGLNPDDIGKLITISGMITRSSPIIPEMIEAFFKCIVCTFTRVCGVIDGRVEEPHVCPSCSSKFCYELIHNRCRYIDRQLIKLQESPEDMPAGQTPSTVTLVALQDMVDAVNPGDRIYVTGIYRAGIVRVNPRLRKSKTAFRTMIDCVHFRKVKAGRLHDESLNLRLNPDRVDTLKALAKDENIYERLASSLCPSIYGHIDVKKGVLLQLFGGTRKEAPGSATDPKLRHFRADLNILLCGDPGTSKSQILQFVHKLVPRGQYTSGKGSSAVGLTAYVTRDVDTRQLVLQTGALVMCDGGICCIDEFDKMSDATRSVLHEVMEQQTLSVAKAGIVCQLNARTSVLAAANPVASQWDKEKTIIDNIQLPDTLLSRFDLIFLMLDPNNDDYDTLLAKHLISIYHGVADASFAGLIDRNLVRDYIAYARANISPLLTQDTVDHLMEHYMNLREKSRATKGAVTFYPRNLESLIRLSEAHAKMRHSEVVEPEDVDEAVRLTTEALKHDYMDPNTGKVCSMPLVD